MYNDLAINSLISYDFETTGLKTNTVRIIEKMEIKEYTFEDLRQ